MKSLGNLSKYTKQSFSTVAQPDLVDNVTTSNRPQTVYEPSVQAGGRAVRVPDLPNVPFGMTSFDCPYCFSKLDMHLMKQRQFWN